MFLLLAAQLPTILLRTVPSTRYSPPEVLSWAPRVFRLPGLFDATECDGVVDFAKRSIREANSDNLGKGSVGENSRTSTTFWLNHSVEHAEPRLRAFVARIHQAVMLPLHHGEELQLARYREGQAYEFHHDTDARLARQLTVLVYLTDVPPEAGGETIFPFVETTPAPATIEARRAALGAFYRARNATDKLAPQVLGTLLARPYPVLCAALLAKYGELPEGWLPPPLNLQALHTGGGIAPMSPYCTEEPASMLRVHPKKGDALVFYSMSPQLRVDEGAWHGACPVRGHAHEKWVAQRWIKWQSKKGRFYVGP